VLDGDSIYLSVFDARLLLASIFRNGRTVILGRCC
jgi:hypothetical protein